MIPEQVTRHRVTFRPAEATGIHEIEAVNCVWCVKIPRTREPLGSTLERPIRTLIGMHTDVCWVVRIPLQIVRARVSSYKF